MSKYTTDCVLKMIEQWADQNEQFVGFEGLLGADLAGIDLSRGTILTKAKEWIERHPDEVRPPWVGRHGWSSIRLDERSQQDGGVNLVNAVLSKHPEQRVDLRQANLTSANLIGAQLEGANLANCRLAGANLSGSSLQGASLVGANLQRAMLSDADLRGATLIEAHLDGADLRGARLEGADLRRTDLRDAELGLAHLTEASLYGADLKQARIEDVDWTDGYRLGEEVRGDYAEAETVYRQLKQYYNRCGRYDVAGEFHKREMLMRRKSSWGKGRRKSTEAIALLIFEASCGYSERPSWVLGWWAIVVLVPALFYWLWGDVKPGGFGNALYYSAASTGYGRWAPDATGWSAALSPVQGVLGVLLASLFLVTFVRKMAR